MTVAPVGIRCPEHAGKGAPSPVRAARRARRWSYEGTGAVVTRALVAVIVFVYLLQLGMGAGVNAASGWIYQHFALVANAVYADGSPAGVAHGEWWRLFTTAFLHYGPLHLGLNMLALWWLGAPVEMTLGRGRFLLLYVVSGLAGSAGALFWSPSAITVGASGAIFGMLGAGLILEYQATGSLAGNYLTLIVINLAFSVGFGGNISVGGHVGGLIGGILGVLALSRLGRGHAAYGRVGLVGVAGLVAIGVLSIAVAYWKVKGLA